MARVLPGVALVLTRFFRCTRVLISEDFPTFERPANATSGSGCRGYCAGETALATNTAVAIFIANSGIAWTIADTGDSHVSGLFPCGRCSTPCLPQRRTTPTMIFGAAMHNGFQLIVSITWHLRRRRRRLTLPPCGPGRGDKYLAHGNIQDKATQGQHDEPRPVI